MDIKITINFFKDKFKNSELGILKSESLERSQVHLVQMQYPF